MPTVRKQLKCRSCQHVRGAVYEVVNAFTGHVLTAWNAAFTGGYDRTFPRGLCFVISSEPSASATAASADPKQYSEWEKVLVDAEDLRDPKYSGYYLVIDFKLLRDNCKRLS